MIKILRRFLIVSTFCLLLFLSVSLFAPEFIQIAYIDKGMGYNGSLIGFDTNHNGRNEIIFYWSHISLYGIKFYEYQDTSENYLNVFNIHDYCAPNDAGYIDNDSLTDIVTRYETFRISNLSIYESPVYDSFPSLPVWTTPLPTGTDYCAKITDMDCDGNKDIVLNSDHTYFIFENIGDNSYNLVYSDSFSFVTADFSIGDFDCDGKMEIESGEMYGYQYVIENAVVGEDTFEITWDDSIPGVTSLYSHASSQDMDQDGKPEFIAAGNILPAWDRLVTIYETTGDNSYERVWTKIFPNGASPGKPSIIACGDVDDDGIDEMIISVLNRVYMFEAIGNDTYEQIWFYPIGSLITGLLVYDLNKNGINEFAIGTVDGIRIYEYVPPGVEEEQNFTQTHPEISISPNPFRDKVKIDFILPKKARIKASIYDVSGRLVKEPHRGIYKDSPLIWDGKDSSGNELQGGVYFIKLTSGDFTSVKKVILVR